MSEKFTFITPFFEWHGIGFLDVILQAMNDAYQKNSALPSNTERFDSYQMHEKFSQNGELKCLERVVYLLPKNYQVIVGRSSRWKEFVSDEKQKNIRESIKRTATNYAETKEDLEKLVLYFNSTEDKNFPDYQWLKENWRHHQDLWHIMNEFSIGTQVAWYKDNSSIYKKSQKIEFVELEIEYAQLHDEYGTATALRDWLAEQHLNQHTYVNLWGAMTSFQIAFHYLSWASPRFKSAHLVKCINEKKSNVQERLTPIRIEQANKDLLVQLRADDLGQYGLSDQQEKTYRWLNKYRELGDNFTILLLGPRGIGKTKVVRDVYADKDGDVISVNCAQFQSNPGLARSELFGYEKGAFTGADEKKTGAFSEANNKTLFLDEIHHLDKATQSLLLTALQTDDEGFFAFTPLGNNNQEKVRFQLITASNQKIEQLAELILPDLLDRISQRTLEFSPLQSGVAIRGEFIHVWDKMEFKGVYNPIDEDKEFLSWLASEDRVFSGNYRDLQKIAILCADHHRCSDLLKNTSLVSYVESTWRQTIASRPKDVSIENFLDEHNKFSLKEITDEFKAKVVRAAELYNGDIKTAANMLGITPKNLIEIKRRVKD
ncbi:sigma 54-interacting transcriptional regulator [Photobacterium sanguinicancri]|uniref:sigma 54-interacting transcriptional regulator n=1 Tax=Photobacterium sanguinicancri TaxID=875932 RepID=UPI0021C41B75|nr:sigma 54-interacting transcriptional regulator [Photobacterium sanguinicancri]